MLSQHSRPRRAHAVGGMIISAARSGSFCQFCHLARLNKRQRLSG